MTWNVNGISKLRHLLSSDVTQAMMKRDLKKSAGNSRGEDRGAYRHVISDGPMNYAIIDTSICRYGEFAHYRRTSFINDVPSLKCELKVDELPTTCLLRPSGLLSIPHQAGCNPSIYGARL